MARGFEKIKPLQRKTKKVVNRRQGKVGKARKKEAYAFRKLMEQNGWLPLGTNLPVEDINPILTFYAAAVREDAKDFPEGDYQLDNALSREQTLRGMTIWAAKANFEEQEKGGLEVGKFADFIILNQNLMEVAPLGILKTKVLLTFVNGEKV
ncbi:MAG: amidohydrolase family protein [Saprospiraceae bacterium]|nr:amidohydrolase family protein [Saprospiraceae bacterium]